jgi:hypothetical protein
MRKDPTEPPDSAADLRRRLAAASQPDRSVPTVPIIGRGCTTAECFTHHVAQYLGYPRLHQEPGETEGQFLVRRLNQLKVYSRHWAQASLESLTPDLLALAAMQICDAAANFAQDKVCEGEHRRRLEQQR